jgi:hypothetical protein
MRGWAGPRIGLDAVEKRKILHSRGSKQGVCKIETKQEMRELYNIPNLTIDSKMRILECGTTMGNKMAVKKFCLK